MSLHTLLNTRLGDVHQRYQGFKASHGPLDVYFTGHAVEARDSTVVYAFEEPVLVQEMTRTTFTIALRDGSFRWTLRLPGIPMGRPIHSVVKGRQQAQNRFEFCQAGHKPKRGTPTHLDQATVLAARAAAIGKPSPSHLEEQPSVPPREQVTQHRQTPTITHKKSTIESHYTAVIRWYGPFTRQDIETTQKHRGRGLYLFAGRLNHQQATQILYCGMTKNLFRIRFANHEQLPHIPQNDLKIWLGNPLYPERPTPELLYRAEHMLIYFLQPVLNGPGKIAPSKAATIISYWHDAQCRPPLSPVQELPDVASYDGSHWYKGGLTGF